MAVQRAVCLDFITECVDILRSAWIYYGVGGYITECVDILRSAWIYYGVRGYITECVDILRENLCLCEVNIREHS